MRKMNYNNYPFNNENYDLDELINLTEIEDSDLKWVLTLFKKGLNLRDISRVTDIDYDRVRDMIKECVIGKIAKATKPSKDEEEDFSTRDTNTMAMLDFYGLKPFKIDVRGSENNNVYFHYADVEKCKDIQNNFYIKSLSCEPFALFESKKIVMSIITKAKNDIDVTDYLA